MGKYESEATIAHETFRRLETALLRLHSIEIYKYGGMRRAAAILGVKEQRLANWRVRGIPGSALKRCADMAGINPSYLLGVSEAMGVPPKQIPNNSGPTNHTPARKQTAR